MMFKYEFGIPVTDCVRWSKAFSTLIKWNQMIDNIIV
jgi:hypothetical protein